MATTGQMLMKFESLNIEAEAVDIIESTERTIVGYNQAQLYGKGEGADGEMLPKYRNSEYAEYKHGMNSQPGLGNPDYYLTGEMFSLMKAQVESGKLKIISTAAHYSKLIARGGDPFGLQPKSKVDYIVRIFNPEIVRRISQKTGVKIG